MRVTSHILGRKIDKKDRGKCAHAVFVSQTRIHYTVLCQTTQCSQAHLHKADRSPLAIPAEKQRNSENMQIKQPILNSQHNHSEKSQISEADKNTQAQKVCTKLLKLSRTFGFS